MAITLGPINRLSLRFECAEGAAGMIFDDEVCDWGSLATALRARLNVNVRHIRFRQIAFDNARCIGQSHSDV